jgi:hypothetical protein
MDLSSLLDALPPRYSLYCVLPIMLCKLVTVFMPPPDAQSRWAALYRMISVIALNVGWAENRMQVDEAGIMVPRDKVDAIKPAVATLLRPKTTGAPTVSLVIPQRVSRND